MQTPESFEKFYFAKVGQGEACGCAERIIDIFEFNRKAGAIDRRDLQANRPKRKSLRSLALRFGLISRPKM